MRLESIVGAVVGFGGVVLAVGLLAYGKIGEVTFAGVFAISALVGVALHGFARLQSINLKELTVIFRQFEAAKSELIQVTKELEKMYGGIDKLRREPLVLDDAKIESLGLTAGGLTTGSATMRYPVGCMKRERERLAMIFIRENSPEGIAKAILDNSLDDNVFKWAGPESPLDEPPISVEARKRRKGQASN